MSSVTHVSAKFEQPGQSWAVKIEWDKHEGLRVLVLNKHATDDYFQVTKKLPKRNLADAFPAFERECVLLKGSFIAADARLMAGRAGALKVGCHNENHVRMAKVGEHFAVTLVEELKERIGGPTKDEKILEVTVVNTFEAGLSQIGKDLISDQKTAQAEHEEWLKRMKDEGKI